MVLRFDSLLLKGKPCTYLLSNALYHKSNVNPYESRIWLQDQPKCSSSEHLGIQTGFYSSSSTVFDEWPINLQQLAPKHRRARKDTLSQEQICDHRSETFMFCAYLPWPATAMKLRATTPSRSLQQAIQRTCSSARHTRRGICIRCHRQSNTSPRAAPRQATHCHTSLRPLGNSQLALPASFVAGQRRGITSVENGAYGWASCLQDQNWQMSSQSRRPWANPRVRWPCRGRTSEGRRAPTRLADLQRRRQHNTKDWWAFRHHSESATSPWWASSLRCATNHTPHPRIAQTWTSGSIWAFVWGRWW